jgi:hypothetical protein
MPPAHREEPPWAIPWSLCPLARWECIQPPLHQMNKRNTLPTRSESPLTNHMRSKLSRCSGPVTCEQSVLRPPLHGSLSLKGSSVPLTTHGIVRSTSSFHSPAKLRWKSHGQGPVRAQTTGNVLHFSIRESYNKKSVARWPVHVKHSLLTKSVSVPAKLLRPQLPAD